ncbi:MAG: hypothetical protein ACRECO_07465 [Xanthobacteraceae bacterium]
MKFSGDPARMLHARLAAAILCLAVAGCVTSSEPVLGDAKAILGERGQLHIFTAPKNGERDVLRYRFQWHKDRYVTPPSGGTGTSEFTAHAFEGRDLIVQWTGAPLWTPKRKLTVRQIHYYLARRVAEGTYLFFPISEDDADDAARKRFCTSSPETKCRISTPEQLFVFARAAAEKEDHDAGVAVIVPTRPPAKGKKR